MSESAETLVEGPPLSERFDEPEDEAVHRIKFKANPVQFDFIKSRKQADLFSSRMGEGKSTALVWTAYLHAEEHPGLKPNFLIIRDTWENLKRTTLLEFFEWFPPGQCGEWIAGDKTFKWKMGENRGKVSFMGLDDPKDASSLQSLVLAGAGLDEPAPLADSGGISEEIFNTVLLRMRAKLMNWYPCKLAQNNPDENHWTYRRFVNPGDPEFGNFQTAVPENLDNLPPDYMKRMAHALRHRPDLARRFIQGQYGFTRIGKSVTPQFDERLHLAEGLEPIADLGLYLLYDFGLSPVCIITQITPLGRWHFLESFLGETGDGMQQLLEQQVVPVLAQRYSKAREIIHIGDPNGGMREQSNSQNSAVRTIQKLIYGKWIPGPVELKPRIDPLNAVLSRVNEGVGVVQIDKNRAKHVWHALRGGWHYKMSGEVVSQTPVKDKHSHPGDATGYGAFHLFPSGVFRGIRRKRYPKPGQARYNQGKQGRNIGGQISRHNKIPKEFRKPGRLR